MLHPFARPLPALNTMMFALKFQRSDTMACLKKMIEEKVEVSPSAQVFMTLATEEPYVPDGTKMSTWLQEG